jgi:hypothetical protein
MLSKENSESEDISVGEKLSSLMVNLLDNKNLSQKTRNEVSDILPRMFIFPFSHQLFADIIPGVELFKKKEFREKTEQSGFINHCVFPPSGCCCCWNNYQRHICIHQLCYQYNQTRKKLTFYTHGVKILCIVCSYGLSKSS